MYFLLGYISGLLTAVLIFSILAIFKSRIEIGIERVETKLGSVGPRQRGAIFLPDSDAEIARQEIIRKNKEAGKDTPISELR